jgi:hypothetical protein
MSEPRRELAAALGLLVLRLGAGGLLLFGHGWGKIVRYGERAATFADPLGVGPAWSLALVVLAEVPCAGPVMAGLLTRAAAVPIVVFLCVRLHPPSPGPLAPARAGVHLPGPVPGPAAHGPRALLAGRLARPPAGPRPARRIAGAAASTRARGAREAGGAGGGVRDRAGARRYSNSGIWCASSAPAPRPAARAS